MVSGMAIVKDIMEEVFPAEATGKVVDIISD
jgi:hypothetical protein